VITFKLVSIFILNYNKNDINIYLI
jgi:hypothetical protein